jgi:putative flippase GtrA
MPAIVSAGFAMFLFKRRPLLFVVVGSLAALTHLLTVIFIVEALDVVPLKANVIGWLCAFGVSYGGHFRLTFADHAAPPLRSILRFFLLSAAGFAINESAYALLLHVTVLPYQLLLALILVAVAGFTYLASQRWAFQGTTP